MGTVSQLRPSAAVFDARVAAAACEAQLSRIALLVGLAIVAATNAEGRAAVNAASLADRVGFSRPSVLKGMRVVEERGLGARERGEGGNIYPLFIWDVDRLPSLVNVERVDPAEDVEGTSRKLWQEVYSARYREAYARETSVGRVSGVPPYGWPKDDGWEALTEWSARRAGELRVDARSLVEIAVDSFLALGDSVDVNLKLKRHPLSFLAPLLGHVDKAVVARLTQPRMKSTVAPRQESAAVAEAAAPIETSLSRAAASAALLAAIGNGGRS